jgi:hypothetical protein
VASSRYIVPIHYTREREHGCFFLLTSTAGDCPHAPAQPWRDLPWLYERGPFDASELSAFDGSDVPITRSAPPSTNRCFAGGKRGGGLRSSRRHGTSFLGQTTRPLPCKRCTVRTGKNRRTRVAASTVTRVRAAELEDFWAKADGAGHGTRTERARSGAVGGVR